MRSSTPAVLAALAIALAPAAPAAEPARAASPLGAEILAFEGALTEAAVPGWAAQRATWARLVSTGQDPQVLATCLLTLEQSMGWEAVEATWKARRPAWGSEAGRATSMGAVAKLLLDLEGNTRWSAVREAWKKDRDGWVRRVSALAPATAPAPPRAAPAGVGPTAPAAAGAIPLETVSSPEMGYQILIPKGAKVLGKMAWQHTYSLMLDRMHEINVSLADVGADSLDTALRIIEMAGAKQITEKSQLGPGQYDVVAVFMPGILEVHAYRQKGRVPIRAKCMGPAAHLALLKQICGSLEIVK